VLWPEAMWVTWAGKCRGRFPAVPVRSTCPTRTEPITMVPDTTRTIQYKSIYETGNMIINWEYLQKIHSVTCRYDIDRDDPYFDLRYEDTNLSVSEIYYQ